MGANPTVVLLDLDDTICRYRRSRAELLDSAFERTTVEPFFTVAEFEEWIPKVTGENKLDLLEKCFCGIANEKERSSELAVQLAANYPERDPTNVTFLPGAETALEALSDTYRLGIVSNGAVVTQRAKIEILDIGDFFEVEIFATPEKALKPDPEPFYRALDAFDMTKTQAIHIGNSIASDIVGAQAAGLPAVWLRTDGATSSNTTSEYIIDSLFELHQNPMPWE